jgi:hypothetical protein
MHLRLSEAARDSVWKSSLKLQRHGPPPRSPGLEATSPLQTLTSQPQSGAALAAGALGAAGRGAVERRP